jgi:hypothetical protein
MLWLFAFSFAASLSEVSGLSGKVQIPTLLQYFYAKDNPNHNQRTFQVFYAGGSIPTTFCKQFRRPANDMRVLEASEIAAVSRSVPILKLQICKNSRRP